MTYNRDIAHCSGYCCSLAESCKRYWLFLQWEKEENRGNIIPATFIPSCYNEETNNCEFFIKDEL
jgi:hypothetical protein